MCALLWFCVCAASSELESELESVLGYHNIKISEVRKEMVCGLGCGICRRDKDHS